MASAAAAPVADPRWKTLIAKSIAENIKNDGSVCSPPTPQVRYVVHRGFVNEKRADTPEGVEPALDGFACGTALLTTTDVRAPKAQQIRDSIERTGSAQAQIAWWHDPSKLQFRITGTLHLVPHANHPTLRPLPSEAAPPKISGQSWDWQQERKRIFEKLSPSLLASFARPTPGSDHPQGNSRGDGPGEGEGKGDASPWPLELPKPTDEGITDEQEKLLEKSNENFALVVLLPREVDVVDLNRDRRSVFKRKSEGTGKGAHEEWEETRVVP
ncbi:hypothetical protein IE81DRAFT_331268 [Ceraceosorus guamensis]|uniref:Pyridoxamine 5'-phosphate oxidase Alr4036 family FMN-binding domain-containing protein n=1 Tax=Ceraceosorus guamensis TaxID=1522189 RepID=A0A316VXH2_9BASI|nr:hypothetical protein IE81DRAFT_331268 [Ceraceosorus guamensis]PWN40991.1 hypothetical protein IE81DRAFT_331268 [Ceraceosorus guamensis]